MHWTSKMDTKIAVMKEQSIELTYWPSKVPIHKNKVSFNNSVFINPIKPITILPKQAWDSPYD